jgi:hypothetical protein
MPGRDKMPDWIQRLPDRPHQVDVAALLAEWGPPARAGEDRAYSRPGHPGWRKLTARQWAAWDSAVELDQRREAAWQRNAAQRDAAMRLYEAKRAELDAPASQRGLDLAAVCWWEKPPPVTLL